MSESTAHSADLFPRGLGWLRRRQAEIRDRVEWATARILLRRSPWLRNRLGQRFQALCFEDYRYLRQGNPEIRESRLLERLANPGMTVVDVGANHGCFSMEASYFVGSQGRVHAFEPAPATRLALERHLRINGLGNVEVFAAAVGGSAGKGHLRVHTEYTGLNSLAPQELVWYGRRLKADDILEVPLVTLDDHAALEGLARVDILKVDVEGFERDVLRGARGLLTAKRVGWVIYEIDEKTCANSGIPPLETVSELEDLGYSTHEITSEGSIGSRVTGYRRFPGANFAAFARS